MKQITKSFVSGRIEEFPELQDAHRKVKAEYEKLHANMKSLDRRQIDTLPEGEYTVERKWDGIFCGGIGTSLADLRTFITPSGNVYQIARGETFVPDELHIGELFSSGKEDRRERVHTVLSALAKGDYESTRFHPFSECSTLSIDKSKIEEVFEQNIRYGAEGVVIRQINGSVIWKLKPKMNIDCVVIGYTEEIVGEVKNLIVGIPRNYFAIQPLGAVGSNIGTAERKLLWYALQLIKFDASTPMVHDGQSVQIVDPKICVEISCNDIVTEKSNGCPIMKPCYDIGDMSAVGVAPFCTLRGAYFERIRRDRLPSQILTKQVTDYVHIDQIDVDCRTLRGKASQIIEEARFVNGDAVKRLLMVERGQDPEYAIHLTDYSPTRAEPTKYEIEVTLADDQAEQLFDAKSEKILAVRGWSRA